MIPCQSCYICGTWRSEEVGKGEVLKSSCGRASHKIARPIFFLWRVS